MVLVRVLPPVAADEGQVQHAALPGHEAGEQPVGPGVEIGDAGKHQIDGAAAHHDQAVDVAGRMGVLEGAVGQSPHADDSAVLVDQCLVGVGEHRGGTGIERIGQVREGVGLVAVVGIDEGHERQGPSREARRSAKRKGMWMGGVPPLGYDVDNRLLVINEAEAAVVRRIFEEMLTIGSPTQIAVNLTADGITTKAWTTQEGQTRSGTRIDKKYLHKLLRNRIYLGELSHKGNWYPGAHPPIIGRELWDKVHAVLARDGHARSVETKIRSRTDALLRGLLYAPSGERMYPTYSRKNGRKYHYYVSKSESRFGAPGKSYERLPAPEIEAAVVAQIRTVLTSPESIASVVRHIQQNQKTKGGQIDEATTVMAMGRLNDVWDQLFPVERHRIANLMIERIDLVHVGEVQGIKVKWREIGWNALIEEFAPRSIGAEMLEVEA